VFIGKKEPFNYTNTCLYDGQTGERLACARQRTDKHSVLLPDPNTSSISTLNRFQLSSDEAFAFINEQMADDRTQ
jgi:hypothetical protein